MKPRLSRPVGFATAAFSMVLLSREFVGSSCQCNDGYLADGWCDSINNNEECGYDDGDCCEASCVSTSFRCGEFAPYNCLDPDHNGEPATSYSYKFSCEDDLAGNGHCDSVNNNEECGYDGGDCCEASCVDADYVCAENGGFDCHDPDYGSYPEYMAANHVSLCIDKLVGDGYCDPENNNHYCGYDGGDCCKGSCVDGTYVCGENGFDCVDRNHQANDYPQQSSYAFTCDDDLVGNGICDYENNMEECGYDGGDCCYCTCVATSSFDYTCGGLGYTCMDPGAPCVDDGEYVEAGAVTTVTAVANSHDTNSNEDSALSGCMNTGCVAKLTRDGDTDDDESRWSCKQSIVPNEQLCQIVLSFSEAQDVRSVQVAFRKPDLYPRALDIKVDGLNVGHVESTSEHTFNEFTLHENNVYSVSLTTSGLDADEWIHILEVRILVEEILF